jgi:hypothetical protein
MNNAATRAALRKYADGKSVEIQGAVRNICGTLLLLDRDPKDEIARAQLAINLARFEALKFSQSSEE